MSELSIGEREPNADRQHTLRSQPPTSHKSSTHSDVGVTVVMLHLSVYRPFVRWGAT
jgi:hypothetical protein